MDDRETREAAEILWTNWQAGTRIGHLPERCRPKVREEGYAIQAQVQALSRQGLAGWKIAATSAAGQKHIGVDGPLAGRLLSARVRPAGALVPFGSNHMKVAEAEFAFRFGRDLPPCGRAYGVDEVVSAVAGFHPAIEIPDSRYEDFVRVGGPQLIADSSCAHYAVLGPAAPEEWRKLDLSAHEVECSVGTRLTREGKGANVLGDPRVALTWLVNEINALGFGALSGQFVITGACVVPLEIGPGDRVAADFGALGAVDAFLGV
jgi:2-keto-4-pentenoate hydratase